MTRKILLWITFWFTFAVCGSETDQQLQNDEASTKFVKECRLKKSSSKAISRLPNVVELTKVANRMATVFASLPSPPSSIYCLGEREQYSWTNIPGARSGGIRLDFLNAEQEELVWELLRLFFNERSFQNIYTLITDIEEASGAGTVSDYTVALFGNPGIDPAWGFQFDGHHVALNFVVDGDHVVLSPAFLGSQPTALGTRAPLGNEQKQGSELINSLSSAQMQSAFVADLVRRDILVGSGRGHIDQGIQFELDQFNQVGLPIASFNPDQQQLLHRLLETYIGRLSPSFAEPLLNSIYEDLNQGYFVYSLRDSRKYYRVYVHEKLLIEYADVGRDHIHTVVRLLGEPPYRDYGGYTLNPTSPYPNLQRVSTISHSELAN